MSSRAELSALNSALSELVDRFAQLGDDLTGADRDRLGQDLYEVERTLTSARRRMSRLLDAYPAG